MSIKKKGWFYTDEIITVAKPSNNPPPNPPTEMTQKNNFQQQGDDFLVEFLDKNLDNQEGNFNPNVSVDSLKADPSNQNYGDPLQVTAFFAIFLELDIVKELQLEKLNLFNLVTKSKPVEKFQIIKVFNKRDAVKMYVFNEYTASFSVTGGAGEITPDMPTRKVKFVVPNNVGQNSVEKHLVSLSNFSFQGETIQYQRTTLKRTIPR